MKFDFDRAWNIFSSFSLVLDMFQAILGKPAQESEGKPARFKGIAGVFGKKDEAKFLTSFMGLEHDHQRESILYFINWYKNQYEGKAGWVVLWWWPNAWRTFATVSLSQDASKTGTHKTTWKDPEGKSHTTTKDIFGGGGSGTIKFLERIASIVGSPPTDEGCENLLKEFKSLGVPTAPDPETVKWVNDQIAKVPELARLVGVMGRRRATQGVRLAEAGVTRLDQWVVEEDRKITERRANLSWWQRLLEW